MADDEPVSQAALLEEWEARVRSIASWQQYADHDFDALVQAGREGVLRARIRYFESSLPSPKAPFKTAVWWYVRKAIARAADEERTGESRVDAVRHDASDQKMDEYLADPAEHDLLGGMLAVLDETAAVSFVQVHTDADALPAPETLTPEERVDERRALDRIGAAVGFLGKRERQVIEGRHLDGRTFESIGEVMGLDERWVRELYHRALRQLKATMADQHSAQRRVDTSSRP